MVDDQNTSERHSLHFVDPDTQARAEFCSIGMSLGYHCEIYADFSEVARFPPKAGIVLVRDLSEFGGIGFALDRLMNLGVWLPIVAMDFEPSPGKVVQAIKEGALDYLVLPLRPKRLESCLKRINNEAAAISAERRRRIFAQRQMEALSPREREVLEGLAGGDSNKEIARQLQISPRTVEIHRANMMGKLGVKHPAEAVRIKIESRKYDIRPDMPVAA